jgi:hypothetical protein
LSTSYETASTTHHSHHLASDKLYTTLFTTTINTSKHIPFSKMQFATILSALPFLALASASPLPTGTVEEIPSVVAGSMPQDTTSAYAAPPPACVLRLTQTAGGTTSTPPVDTRDLSSAVTVTYTDGSELYNETFGGTDYILGSVLKDLIVIKGLNEDPAVPNYDPAAVSINYPSTQLGDRPFMDVMSPWMGVNREGEFVSRHGEMRFDCTGKRYVDVGQ